ncbi:MAG TPA: hypothetical protein VH186_22870 [Chloroflexia bacterium]|nr:hypothetical protein [Chloroflexia bacterium]
MSQTEKRNKVNQQTTSANSDERSTDMRQSPMMAHLLDALEKGTDIGHYGRLTFAMIARHFMSDDDLIKLLSKQPDFDETQARALLKQVEARDYNPPKRERILQWQSQQDFAICPTPDDPEGCNVYQELRFPDGIYDNINEYWEEQVGGEDHSHA